MKNTVKRYENANANYAAFGISRKLKNQEQNRQIEILIDASFEFNFVQADPRPPPLPIL